MSHNLFEMFLVTATIGIITSFSVLVIGLLVNFSSFGIGNSFYNTPTTDQKCQQTDKKELYECVNVVLKSCTCIGFFVEETGRNIHTYRDNTNTPHYLYLKSNTECKGIEYGCETKYKKYSPNDPDIYIPQPID